MVGIQIGISQNYKSEEKTSFHRQKLAKETMPQHTNFVQYVTLTNYRYLLIILLSELLYMLVNFSYITIKSCILHTVPNSKVHAQ